MYKTSVSGGGRTDGRTHHQFTTHWKLLLFALAPFEDDAPAPTTSSSSSVGKEVIPAAADSSAMELWINQVVSLHCRQNVKMHVEETSLHG